MLSYLLTFILFIAWSGWEFNRKRKCSTLQLWFYSWQPSIFLAIQVAEVAISIATNLFIAVAIATNTEAAMKTGQMTPKIIYNQATNSCVGQLPVLAQPWCLLPYCMALLSLIIAWSGWELNRGPLAPKESALPLSYGSAPGNRSFSWLFRLRKLLFQLQPRYIYPARHIDSNTL